MKRGVTMAKKEKFSPQEFQNETEGNVIDQTRQSDKSNIELNDIKSETVIIGGGDPNLSPEAGKPLI